MEPSAGGPSPGEESAMHVREVGAAAGVSVALVKFYVREGLLHPGIRESVNTTTYDETHVARLRLIRALVEGGRLPLAAVGELLEAIDDATLPVEVVAHDAHRAVSRLEHPPSDEAVSLVLDAIARQGWQVSEDNPGVLQCASVVDTAMGVGQAGFEEMLTLYAEPAELIARQDLAALSLAPAERSRVAETIVLGTVLGDAMLLGMRRIAQEHLARTTMLLADLQAEGRVPPQRPQSPRDDEGRPAVEAS